MLVSVVQLNYLEDRIFFTGSEAQLLLGYTQLMSYIPGELVLLRTSYACLCVCVCLRSES